jgi:hypothetical protein
MWINDDMYDYSFTLVSYEALDRSDRIFAILGPVLIVKKNSILS